MQTMNQRISAPSTAVSHGRRSQGRHQNGEEPRRTLAATGIVKSYSRGLWPRRRSLNVLRGTDLVLRPGEIVGLVGENGSGKSTLMKILVGSIDRDDGRVARSGSLGYCPQDPILYERLTCDEHFELFGKAYRMTGGDIAVARDDIYATLRFGE